MYQRKSVTIKYKSFYELKNYICAKIKSMWKFNQREKKCIQQTRIVHSSNQFSGKLANPDTSALQPPSNICLLFFGFIILILKEAFATKHQVQVYSISTTEQGLWSTVGG